PNGFPLWSGRSPAPVTTAGFVQQLAQLSLECRVNATRNYINIHESRRVRRVRVTIPLGCGSAALGEVSAFAWLASPREYGGCQLGFLLLVDGPGLAKPLGTLLDESLMELVRQVVDIDRQLAPQVVEQDGRNVLTGLRAGAHKGCMAALPELVGPAEVAKRHVLDFQQSALLEVRRGDSPSSLEVAVYPVADDIPHCLVGVGLLGELDAGLAGIELEREIEGLEDAECQLVVRDSFGTGCQRGLVERGAKQADLNKVVEMAGLERGILAVVGETQKLLRMLLERGILLEHEDDRKAQDCRGGAPAAAGERRQPAEVRISATGSVRDRTVLAKSKWSGCEEEIEATRVDESVGTNRRALGKLFAEVWSEARLRRVDFEPVLW